MAAAVRWWFRLVLYGGFAVQVLAGAVIFALVAYALLAVLGWT